MNTYDIKVGNEEIKLRLTLSGQMALKKKYKDGNVTGLIMTALDDAATCADILTQALTYKGNENKIKDGEELYDLLVDEGYAGYEGFGELLLSVAQVSGIVSEKDKDRLYKMVTGMLDEALEADAEGEEGKN